MMLRLFSPKRAKEKPATNGHVTTASNRKKSVRQISCFGKKRSKSTGSKINLKDFPLPAAPNPYQDPAAYLRSIYAVRERSKLVWNRAKQDNLKHFRVDMTKFDDIVNYVVSIIRRDYADLASIPPHGRWQHFEAGGVKRIDDLMRTWNPMINAKEKTRRLIDLFLVSVLLDAGAGDTWQYKAGDGQVYRRSEGLAVASIEMFFAGLFSSNPHQPHQVDSHRLQNLTVGEMERGFQVSEKNPISGLEGRTNLLIRLAIALKNEHFFGVEARPGCMLDYLLSHPTTTLASVPVIPIPTLWTVLMDGLSPVWPSTRTSLNGISLGDAWPCSSMPSDPSQPWQSIVPFHKLTQWLAYSLMVPMQRFMKVQFVGEELMTGLPEYRNGGLLLDTGFLRVSKQEDIRRGIEACARNARQAGRSLFEVVPLYTPDDDLIVEWRAVTIGALDELLIKVNEKFNELGLLQAGNKLTLAQMLEAGSWKAGREIAEVSRPNLRGPPIQIASQGDLF